MGGLGSASQGLQGSDLQIGAVELKDHDGEDRTAVTSSNELKVIESNIKEVISGSEMQVDIVSDGAGLATSAKQLADGHNVTVDNAGTTAAVNIQDGGNTITVDGTVNANSTLQTGTNIIGKTRLVTATGDEITEDTDDSMNVTIVADDVGVGGGTQYTEDVAAANPQIGNAIMVERDDQLSSVTPVEGDWIGLRGNEKGALWVSLADASGDPITSFGGGTEYVAGTATYAEETTVAKIAGAVRNDTLAALVDTDNEIAPLQVNADGALYVAVSGAVSVTESSPLSGFATSANQLADGHNVTVDNAAAGSAVNIQDGGNTITVDGTVATTGTYWQETQPVSVASVPSHEVTNAGTFAIQVTDTSLAVADGNALGEGLLIQGDDGTDRKNVNVDATTGNLQVDIPGQEYSYDYIPAAGANEITKGSAGFLHAIIVGDAVASSIIEVSNHASDGDGAVVIYLAGDALGPAVYPVNMTMGTGITSDITNQTHVTMVYK